MKKLGLFLILTAASSVWATNFSLGIDFTDTSLDGRLGLTEEIYLGMKLDPGINTQNSDINLDLDLFARFNLFPVVDGLALGPEVGMQLVENGNVDDPILFTNFHADMVFPLRDQIAVYGHLPLIGLKLFLGNFGDDEGPGNNDDDEFAILVFSDLPVELGFLLQF